MKKIMLLVLLMPSLANANVLLSSEILANNTRVGQATEIIGKYHLEITNKTNKDHHYGYHIDLSILNGEQEKSYNTSYRVKAGESKVRDHELRMPFIFNHAGTYTIKISQSFFDAEEASNYVTKTITVK